MIGKVTVSVSNGVSVFGEVVLLPKMSELLSLRHTGQVVRC